MEKKSDKTHLFAEMRYVDQREQDEMNNDVLKAVTNAWYETYILNIGIQFCY